MSLDDLIAVSGLPGLYRMAANRGNGLIVEDLETGKRRFAPTRRHQFTPLASIAIYTDDGDSVALAKVFENMRDQQVDLPVPASDAKSEELFEYFADVLPNYDRERVYPGDVKKVIKWFNALQAANLLTEEEE